MQNIGKKEFLTALGKGIALTAFSIFVIFSSLWVCLALWIQQPFGWLMSRMLIGIWIVFALSILGIYITQHLISRRIDMLIYIVGFIGVLIWYFNITPLQNREWDPEVEKILSYERDGDVITLHNIRNFDWKPDGSYTPRWETRRLDLNKIEGVHIVTSYWMGPQIAHTLVSFNFSDQQPLTFSIEIRKEKNESFSAIGGFFRQFELSLVAADEKDIIYTRSNVRKEQVYLFPIKMPNIQAKALFNEYLKTVDELQQEPRWYNTLTSNCTTLVFDMVQAINPDELPKDYRLIASGYLPNYLYDLKVLSHHYTVPEWYQMAYINERAAEYETFKHKTSANFSAVIREGLPQPNQQP
ncbi:MULTISPECIES: DUF4105 domain-containing protein [unclassified Acinetobacter]|uniref:Lnb N-terminal periplasmic domain-containing protein n=1 Tax=unclassified Acinetobacter TaxID=196816 RepID=UPI0019090F7F|nr:MULTISPECIES: DUF4105 domain-containing protein [unclassified Acinetobacter]MBK0062691.1 DUF4105 domain-containing protein [Acinetobacter sp. S55]MBK0065732.1 DUF4105 domain-containing protein [Acinetobacter sp. S54]